MASARDNVTGSQQRVGEIREMVCHKDDEHRGFVSVGHTSGSRPKPDQIQRRCLSSLSSIFLPTTISSIQASSQLNSHPTYGIQATLGGHSLHKHHEPAQQVPQLARAVPHTNEQELQTQTLDSRVCPSYSPVLAPSNSAKGYRLSPGLRRRDRRRCAASHFHSLLRFISGRRCHRVSLTCLLIYVPLSAGGRPSIQSSARRTTRVSDAQHLPRTR